MHEERHPTGKQPLTLIYECAYDHNNSTPASLHSSDVSVSVMVFLCLSQQGPQGFTGPPGESGEPGPSVSIKISIRKHTNASTTVHCTLLFYCHSHLLCTFVYRVPWVPVAPPAPLERMERMYVYSICSYSPVISHFTLKADFLFASLSLRVSLANLVAPVSADLLAHR